MNKTKTYIILILTGLFVVVSIGLFVFLFRSVKAKNQNSSILSMTIDKKIAEKNNLSNLERTIKETRAQREVLQSYIVDENHLDKFIGWLEESGVSFSTKLVVNSVSRADKPNLLNTSITATGDFADILKLLFFIENSDFKLNIKEVFLSRISTQEGEDAPIVYLWQMQANFSIVSTNQ